MYFRFKKLKKLSWRESMLSILQVPISYFNSVENWQKRRENHYYEVLKMCGELEKQSTFCKKVNKVIIYLELKVKKKHV